MKNKSILLWAVVFTAIAGRSGLTAAPVPAEDTAAVSKLLDQLGADDPADRDRASILLEARPDRDLPLIQDAAKRDDLSPEIKSRLNALLQRMEPRAKAHERDAAYSEKFEPWRAQVTSEYYEKDGHTNPAWDQPARKMIALCRKPLFDLKAAERAELKQAVDQLLNAGCDDPDALGMAAFILIDTEKTKPYSEIFPIFKKAFSAAANGKVSPYWALTIDGRILRGRALGLDGGIDFKNYAPTASLMMEMAGCYSRAMRVEGTPDEAMIAMAKNVMDTGDQIHFPTKELFDVVYPKLEKAVPNNSRVLCIRGEANIHYAWEARGGGWANTVTPQGWQDFADRLAIAHQTLVHAWTLDPMNPDAPTKMLTVALGENWTREETDKWFKRAMDANPDNRAACDAMLYYLEPKWHGSAEEMLAFAHQRFETRNWYSNMPFYLVDVHEKLAALSENPAAYYQSDAVWSDIASVYEAFLSFSPDDADIGSKYARYACVCGHWTEANEEFKKLGDHAEASVFGGKAALQMLKQRAADEAAKKQ